MASLRFKSLETKRRGEQLAPLKGRKKDRQTEREREERERERERERKRKSERA